MDSQTIISIATIAILIVIFLIYLFWEIKKKGLKQVAVTYIIKAEEMYQKGQNTEKMNYVIKKVISKLPVPLQLFITEEVVEKFVQNIFDTVKKALDYVPKEEK